MSTAVDIIGKKDPKKQNNKKTNNNLQQTLHESVSFTRGGIDFLSQQTKTSYIIHIQHYSDLFHLSLYMREDTNEFWESS